MTEDQPAPEGLPAVRTCANCACFGHMDGQGAMVDTPTDSIPVCRRNTPGARQQRLEVPVLDPTTKAPVIDRGRPRMQAQQVVVIGYPATAPAAVCFDGWRPVGTLPGELWHTQRMVQGFRPFMERALIQSGVSKQQAQAMGLAMLTGLLPRST